MMEETIDRKLKVLKNKELSPNKIVKCEDCQCRVTVKQVLKENECIKYQKSNP